MCRGGLSASCSMSRVVVKLSPVYDTGTYRSISRLTIASNLELEVHLLPHISLSLSLLLRSLR